MKEYPVLNKYVEEHYQLQDIDKAFVQYIKDGGLAGSYVYQEQEDTMIVSRFEVMEQQELVFQYIYE